MMRMMTMKKMLMLMDADREKKEDDGLLEVPISSLAPQEHEGVVCGYLVVVQLVIQLRSVGHSIHHNTMEARCV